MSSNLVIGVPSKGRLQENCDACFARAGLIILKSGNVRTYTGAIEGVPNVDIAFLSASEISCSLADGSVHLGVTGEDLIRENIPDADKKIHIVTPLGFGPANVVVAVPQSWIDVSTMDDLDDVAASRYARNGELLRVATKYLNLTRNFFEQHGVADYRIVESQGATEGAPAGGSADIIVDITTTGATLAANALKVLDNGTILKSQANLAASLTADWSEDARAALKTVLARIAADIRARDIREVRFEAKDPGITKTAAKDFGCTVRSNSGEVNVLHVPADDLYALIDWLGEQNTGPVSVSRLEYVFEKDSGLYDSLAERLEWTA